MKKEQQPCTDTQVLLFAYQQQQLTDRERVQREQQSREGILVIALTTAPKKKETS